MAPDRRDGREQTAGNGALPRRPQQRQLRRRHRFLEPVHGRSESGAEQISVNRSFAGQPVPLEGSRARQALRRPDARTRSEEATGADSGVREATV